VTLAAQFIGLLVLNVLVSACALPESKDVDNASVSITLATPTGAVHVLLACPLVPGTLPAAHK